MGFLATARRKRRADRARYEARVRAAAGLPEGMRREPLDFRRLHAVCAPLTSFLGGSRPAAAGFGEAARRRALGRITRVERARPEGMAGADVYHVWLKKLPAAALARLARGMRAREGAGARRLTQLEAMEALGPAVKLLELREDASVVVHDSQTGRVVFYKLARPPPVVGLLDDEFGGDEDALAKRLFAAREVSGREALKRGVEADATRPTYLAGLTAQTNWMSAVARVRPVAWTQTLEGARYVASTLKPVAEAVYASAALVVPAEVGAALADLDARFLRTPVGEVARPLGRRAALAIEVALGVEVLTHYDGNNAEGHPSAYLVFHRRGGDGQRPVGGNLIMLEYGTVCEVGSLAVVGGSFKEIAHVSAPVGYDAGLLTSEAADEGKPVRGIAIVFTNQRCLDFLHTGRWVVEGCQCKKGCPALRGRASSERQRRHASLVRKKRRLSDEAAAAADASRDAAAAGGGESAGEGDVMGEGERGL